MQQKKERIPKHRMSNNLFFYEKFFYTEIQLSVFLNFEATCILKPADRHCAFFLDILSNHVLYIILELLGYSATTGSFFMGESFCLFEPVAFFSNNSTALHHV